ncbi:MAG: hypothetical protein EOO65_02435, partial [Methanosarcinales archaeon]
MVYASASAVLIHRLVEGASLAQNPTFYESVLSRSRFLAVEEEEHVPWMYALKCTAVLRSIQFQPSHERANTARSTPFGSRSSSLGANAVPPGVRPGVRSEQHFPHAGVYRYVSVPAHNHSKHAKQNYAPLCNRFMVRLEVHAACMAWSGRSGRGYRNDQPSASGEAAGLSTSSSDIVQPCVPHSLTACAGHQASAACMLGNGLELAATGAAAEAPRHAARSSVGWERGHGCTCVPDHKPEQNYMVADVRLDTGRSLWWMRWESSSNDDVVSYLTTPGNALLCAPATFHPVKVCAGTKRRRSSGVRTAAAAAANVLTVTGPPDLPPLVAIATADAGIASTGMLTEYTPEHVATFVKKSCHAGLSHEHQRLWSALAQCIKFGVVDPDIRARVDESELPADGVLGIPLSVTLEFSMSRIPLDTSIDLSSEAVYPALLNLLRAMTSPTRTILGQRGTRRRIDAADTLPSLVSPTASPLGVAAGWQHDNGGCDEGIRLLPSSWKMETLDALRSMPSINTPAAMLNSLVAPFVSQSTLYPVVQRLLLTAPLDKTIKQHQLQAIHWMLERETSSSVARWLSPADVEDPHHAAGTSTSVLEGQALPPTAVALPPVTTSFARQETAALQDMAAVDVPLLCGNADVPGCVLPDAHHPLDLYAWYVSAQRRCTHRGSPPAPTAHAKRTQTMDA